MTTPTVTPGGGIELESQAVNFHSDTHTIHIEDAAPPAVAAAPAVVLAPTGIPYAQPQPQRPKPKEVTYNNVEAIPSRAASPVFQSPTGEIMQDMPVRHALSNYNSNSQYGMGSRIGQGQPAEAVLRIAGLTGKSVPITAYNGPKDALLAVVKAGVAKSIVPVSTHTHTARIDCR